jgi:hypothetical protein
MTTPRTPGLLLFPAAQQSAVGAKAPSRRTREGMSPGPAEGRFAQRVEVSGESPAPARPLTDAQLRDAIAAALAADPRTAKELARLGDCTPREIENLRQGLHAPRLGLFLRLGHVVPALRKLALEQLGAPAAFDPEEVRRLDEINRKVIELARYQRKAGR